MFLILYPPFENSTTRIAIPEVEALERPPLLEVIPTTSETWRGLPEEFFVS